MVQDFVIAAYRWLLSSADVARQILPIALLFLAVASGIAVWHRRVDPEGAERWRLELPKIARRAGQFALLGLMAMVLCGGMVQAQRTVAARRGVVQHATASRHREPNLSGVVQYSPVVAVLQDKTYTRRLTLPPQFADRIGAEGLQVLSPYLSDPSAQNITKMVDSFKRSGGDLVFTREVTRRDELPVAGDTAYLKVDFQDRGSPGGKRHYEAEFNGQYSFHNPSAQAATMRFEFPLPQGGGTMQQFYFDVAGKRVNEPDERGLYTWTGSVEPGVAVKVLAHYRLSGAGGFDYGLGSDRRRIGDFKMVTTSSRPPRFGKAGIYPTSLNGATAEWRLRDVMTTQSISLVFPRADLPAQLLDKTLSILPLALLLFAFGAAWVRLDRAVWAVVAFGLGLLGIPVLSAYLMPNLATGAGAIVALLVGGFVLGRPRGWILSTLCAAVACAFLTVENGSLVVWAEASAFCIVLGLRVMSNRIERPAEV